MNLFQYFTSVNAVSFNCNNSKMFSLCFNVLIRYQQTGLKDRYNHFISLYLLTTSKLKLKENIGFIHYNLMFVSVAINMRRP